MDEFSFGILSCSIHDERSCALADSFGGKEIGYTGGGSQEIGTSSGSLSVSWCRNFLPERILCHRSIPDEHWVARQCLLGLEGHLDLLFNRVDNEVPVSGNLVGNGFFV